jgi:hypothetical protein
VKLPILIDADEVAGVYAALCSMVLDIHCPQDQLTAEEWEKAKSTWARLEHEMNRRALEEKNEHTTTAHDR